MHAQRLYKWTLMGLLRFNHPTFEVQEHLALTTRVTHPKNRKCTDVSSA